MTRRTLTLKSKRFREERQAVWKEMEALLHRICLLYTSPSPRDGLLSRMPSSA